MRTRTLLLSGALVAAVGIGFAVGYVVHSPSSQQADNFATVPAVIGMSSSNAAATITREGLSVTIVSSPSPSVHRGIVLGAIALTGQEGPTRLDRAADSE